MANGIPKLLAISIIFLFFLGIVCAQDVNETDTGTTDDTQDVISDGDTATSQREGIRNVTFSDGYNGYCINMSKDHAYVGSEFTIKDTSFAINNKYNTPIGNYLKILFVDYYDFAIKDADNTSEVIWDFSDRYYLDSSNPITQAILKDAEDGRTIPDHGAVKKINSTTEAVFDFEIFNPSDDSIQNFFGYEITFRSIQNTQNTTENITNGTDSAANETASNTTETNNNKKENTTTETSNTNKKESTVTQQNKNTSEKTIANSNKTSSTADAEMQNDKAAGNPILLLLFSCLVAVFRREK